MWIARRIFDALTSDLAEARARTKAIDEQTATFRTQIAFLIARINQLERERAVLFKRVTQLDVPTPELLAIPPTPMPTTDMLAALGSSLFDDMGDERARVEGVQWDKDGKVVYRETRKEPANAE